MGSLMWLLQWSIRAIVLLIVAWLPLGVELSSFPIALLAAVVIGMLGLDVDFTRAAALITAAPVA